MKRPFAIAIARMGPEFEARCRAMLMVGAGAVRIASRLCRAPILSWMGAAGTSPWRKCQRERVTERDWGQYPIADSTNA